MAIWRPVGGEPRPLTESDWEIARRVGPTLKAKGLICWPDIIGDRLTEVNVTSPTCIREIEAEFPVSITGMLMDAIENVSRNNLPILLVTAPQFVRILGLSLFRSTSDNEFTASLSYCHACSPDPIFRRSVVYICEYNEDGAMGIIINKPLENLQVEGILEKLKITTEAPAGNPS